MHPLGLCNNNDEEDLYEYGWVGVVKLEQPELDPKPCLTVLGKVSTRPSVSLPLWLGFSLKCFPECQITGSGEESCWHSISSLLYPCLRHGLGQIAFSKSLTQLLICEMG